jgi:hypothetical protein
MPVLKRTFAYTKRKVRFAPNCRHSEGGDGRLKAAAAESTLFVSSS